MGQDYKLPIVGQDYGAPRNLRLGHLSPGFEFMDTYHLGKGIGDASIWGLELVSSNLYHILGIDTWVSSKKIRLYVTIPKCFKV